MHGMHAYIYIYIGTVKIVFYRFFYFYVFIYKGEKKPCKPCKPYEPHKQAVFITMQSVKRPCKDRVKACISKNCGHERSIQ